MYLSSSEPEMGMPSATSWRQAHFRLRAGNMITCCWQHSVLLWDLVEVYWARIEYSSSIVRNRGLSMGMKREAEKINFVFARYRGSPISAVSISADFTLSRFLENFSSPQFCRIPRRFTVFSNWQKLKNGDFCVGRLWDYNHQCFDLAIFKHSVLASFFNNFFYFLANILASILGLRVIFEPGVIKKSC